MRNGGGKAKGSQFERFTCQRLSLWVSGDKRDDLFWRSAMSGGRASVKFKKGKANTSQIGDISAIDPMGNVLTDRAVVECKFYASLDLEGWLFGKGHAEQFWRALVRLSLNVKRHPVLIMKQNRRPVMFVTNPQGSEALVDNNAQPLFIVTAGVESTSSAFVYLFETVMANDCPLD